MPFLSIIIPVLNEAPMIRTQLESLQSLRKEGVDIIIVDGGSRDNTFELSRPLVDQAIQSPRGRATQMNAGAQSSTSDVLLFLHADTTLSSSSCDRIHEAISAGAVWGRFDVRIDSAHPLLRIVERMMNWRSRLTGIATGDQGIFVRREVFERVGGYQELLLMEDIQLSKILKKFSPPACLKETVLTSGRRWENKGVIRTVLLMWRLRTEFFFGADPNQLAVRYGYTPKHK